MGFLDVLQAAGNHLNESLPQKYEALCKRLRIVVCLELMKKKDLILMLTPDLLKH